MLIDCAILSVGASLVFGCGAYIFGDKVLMIYTNSEDVIKCGVEILSITTVPYFLCGIMDLFPGRASWNGVFASTYDIISYWYCRNENILDIRHIPKSQNSL